MVTIVLPNEKKAEKEAGDEEEFMSETEKLFDNCEKKRRRLSATNERQNN